MLILTRKNNESIYLGNDIMIKILQTNKYGTKIGIEAPKDILVLRGELKEEIKNANIQANTTLDSDTIKDFQQLLKK